MKKNIDISEGFWKEFKARGFSPTKETGGTFIPDYSNATVKELGKKIYQIVNPKNNTKIMIIDGELFFKTVRKIENIVKYRLFY